MTKRLKTFVFNAYADLEYTATDKLKIAVAVSASLAVIIALLWEIATI